MIDGVFDAAARREEAAAAAVEAAPIGEKQAAREIKRLEKLMFEHAKNSSSRRRRGCATSWRRCANWSSRAGGGQGRAAGAAAEGSLIELLPTQAVFFAWRRQWMGQRSGFGQLFLLDLKTGRLPD